MTTSPSKADIYECYLEETRRNFIAANLLTFGYQLFKTANIIKELDKVIEFYNENDHETILKTFPSKFPALLFESLIDVIKISICFENYFKAKLLLNEFIIHDIDRNSNPNFFKKQRKVPIDIKEIISYRTAKELPTLRKVLKETTINYSIFLENKNYLRYLSMEQKSIDFLAEINKSRNRLHLYISPLTSLSKNILTSYEDLNTIVDKDIAFLQRVLVEKLDPESKTKLPLRL